LILTVSPVFAVTGSDLCDSIRTPFPQTLNNVASDIGNPITEGKEILTPGE